MNQSTEVADPETGLYKKIEMSHRRQLEMQRWAAHYATASRERFRQAFVYAWIALLCCVTSHAIHAKRLLLRLLGNRDRLVSQ